MTTQPHRPGPGEALVAAGIKIMSPAELFTRLGSWPKDDAEIQKHAQQAGVDPKRVSDFLKGNVRVDDNLAEDLSKITGMSAQFWKNTQAAHDYGVAHGQTASTPWMSPPPAP